MPYIQIRDILNRAVEFHKMLADFYLKIENDTERESVELLTDYMARHESVLKDRLSQLSTEQERKISEEWIKYESEFATCDCFEKLKIDEKSNVDDVIDAGLSLNQCLINLYHYTAENAHTEEIKNLFSGLEIMEVAEKKKLARTRGM